MLINFGGQKIRKYGKSRFRKYQALAKPGTLFSGYAMYVNQEDLLLGIIKYFEDIFGGTLVQWATKFVKIYHNPVPNPLVYRYYSVPLINK